MGFEDNKKDPNFIYAMERNIKAYMLYTILALTIISLSLAIAIILIMPLKETKPILLKFSDGDSRFVTINDTNLNVRNDQALLKSILAGYVKNREMINRIDDIERYEEIRTQSNREVWEAFQNIVKTPNSIYSTKNYYRNIRIINVAILNNTIATIDFQAEISNPIRTELSYKKYRAAMQYDFIQVQQTQNETFKNPTGFQISKYQITEITDTKENK